MSNASAVLKTLLTKHAEIPVPGQPAAAPAPAPATPGLLDQGKALANKGLDAVQPYINKGLDYAKGFNSMDPRKWDTSHQMAGLAAGGVGAGLLLAHLLRRKQKPQPRLA